MDPQFCQAKSNFAIGLSHKTIICAPYLPYAQSFDVNYSQIPCISEILRPLKRISERVLFDMTEGWELEHNNHSQKSLIDYSCSHILKINSDFRQATIFLAYQTAKTSNKELR